MLIKYYRNGKFVTKLMTEQECEITQPLVTYICDSYEILPNPKIYSEIDSDNYFVRQIFAEEKLDNYIDADKPEGLENPKWDGEKWINDN